MKKALILIFILFYTVSLESKTNSKMIKRILKGTTTTIKKINKKKLFRLSRKLLKYSKKYIVKRKKNYRTLLRKRFSKLPKSRLSKNKRRRITSLEKKLINSNTPRKTKVFNRKVIKRKIFSCNKENISLMLKGLAPFGEDNKKVHLHHLRQQKNAEIVELTETEHTKYSKILHRYNRTSTDITDRNNQFAKFRKQYWKSRASECIARKK